MRIVPGSVFSFSVTRKNTLPYFRAQYKPQNEPERTKMNAALRSRLLRTPRDPQAAC
jgi:hypothetical protein